MTRDRRQVVAIAITGILTALGLTCRYEFPSFTNKTGSMEPTIAVGEMMLFRRTKNVQRGDIIAFRYPLQPDVSFAKRIIGIPGEVIEINDKRVILDGKVIDEPYAHHVDDQVYPKNPAIPEPYRSRDQFGPMKIPPDSFFVLGDNRDRSSDSRYWGCVPRRLITGKIVLIASRGGWRRP